MRDVETEQDREGAKRVSLLCISPCRASGLLVCGESFSPTIHLQLSHPSSSRETDEKLLECISEECMSNGVAVVVAKYLQEELKIPPAR